MSLIVKNQKIFENKIDIAVSGLPFEVLLQAMVLSSNLELNSVLDEVFSKLIEMLSNFLANISVNDTWQI